LHRRRPPSSGGSRDGDVAGVAVGGVHPHADAQIEEPLHEQGADTAAQRNHRYGPGLRVGEGEVAIRLQRGIGVDDPLAVRAEHPDAVLPRIGEKRLLELRALLAHLAEPGGVDDDRLDALLPAILDRLGTSLAGMMMCARSTPPGISSSALYALTPRTSGAVD